MTTLRDQHTAAESAKTIPPEPVLFWLFSDPDSEINLIAKTMKTVPTTMRMLIGLSKMKKAHTVTKRGKVLLTGTVRDTPILFNEVKKRMSPTKNAKNADTKSQRSRV